MNISTTASHYDLAPSLKDYAEERVFNLKKYFDRIVNAHIIFSLEKYRHRVEITLHVNGRDFVSVEESDDVYASLDGSVAKLETQLRRHKDKIRRHKSQQSIGDAVAEDEVAEDAEPDEDAMENDRFEAAPEGLM